MTHTQTQTPAQAAWAAHAAKVSKALDRLDLDLDKAAPFGPYALKIVPDDSPSMPWQDSDGMTPLAWYSLGGGGLQVEGQDSDPLDPLEGVAPAWVSRNWRKLAAALDLDPAAHDLEAREYSRDYGQTLGKSRLDLFSDRLGEMKSDADSYRAWGSVRDYFDALESVWKLRGVAVLTFQRNGYSQGDSILGLLVATPDWCKRMGIKPGADMAKDLEAQADCLGAWAFGDCYGFTLEDRATGETLDSCFGFLGRYYEKGAYILEAAAESIVSHDLDRRRARPEAAKRFARNRVPLPVRARELDALPLAWADMTPRSLAALEDSE